MEFLQSRMLQSRRTTSADTRIGNLQEASLKADQRLADLAQKYKQLRYQLEKTGAELSKDDFTALRMQIEQTELQILGAERRRDQTLRELNNQQRSI